MSKKAALWVVLAAALALSACDGVRSRDDRDASTPSGFKVPRWLVLKFDEVNARSGPSEENRVLWTYRTRGLPVQVVAETKEWRRICDPDGGLVWVKKGQVDGRRNVMRTGSMALVLLKAPKAGAATAAYLRPRSLAQFEACKDGWCRIKAGGVSGWAPAGELWGVAEQPQCRGVPARPAPKPLP
jgi:SH3-like domain-containing protein